MNFSGWLNTVGLEKVNDKKVIYETHLRKQVIDPSAFRFYYPPLIQETLLRSTIRVACLKEDQDVCLGYSVFEEDILHFVFVKSNFRRLGLATLLMPKTIKTVTQMTSKGYLMMKRRFPEASFNPFAFYCREIL
jgi:hypothetical protein